MAGYTTLFVLATALIAQLAKGHAEGRLEERLIEARRPADRLLMWQARPMPALHNRLRT